MSRQTDRGRERQTYWETDREAPRGRQRDIQGDRHVCWMERKTDREVKGGGETER